MISAVYSKASALFSKNLVFRIKQMFKKSIIRNQFIIKVNDNSLLSHLNVILVVGILIILPDHQTSVSIIQVDIVVNIATTTASTTGTARHVHEQDGRN